MNSPRMILFSEPRAWIDFQQHPRTSSGRPPVSIMSMPPSRAQSEVFSASQYGGPASQRKRYSINYFILPVFILEIVGLACLWALWYYLRFTSVFPYHQRVFYCRDVELYKPNFRPDDFNLYVSYTVLYVLCFCIPPVVIIIGEVMFWLFSTKPRKTVYANCKECKVHLFTRRVLRFISVFMFGALIVQIFVDTIKLITGYQRPYFLSLCNVSIPRCTAPLEHSPSPSPNRACLFDTDAEALRYAWLTFPSLFAAFSSYSAIFASLYVFYMVNLRGAPLLRPFLICGFLGMAIIASFSRIQGYKNHWVDIWVGWIIGTVLAFFLCHAVLCFQEVYHIVIEKPPVEERISPFFSWFRLPRVQAPSLKEEYVVYEEDQPPPVRHRQRNQDRTYEVTTTTESFQRTIAPPHQNGHGYGPQY